MSDGVAQLFGFRAGCMTLELEDGTWLLARDDGESAELSTLDIEQMLSEFLGEVM